MSAESSKNHICRCGLQMEQKFFKGGYPPIWRCRSCEYKWMERTAPMNTDHAPDGLIDSFPALKRKQWYKGPDIAALDESGRRLFFRSGDLAARLCLNGETIRVYDEGNKQAACTLLHAERYLADRLAYELAPWPKGMMKLETDDAYALPARKDVTQ